MYVFKRTKEFWEERVKKQEYENYRFLIASHGCASRAIMQNVYGDHDFWHGEVPPNCSVNIVDVKDGESVVVEADRVYY